jgi:hypothetical protein
LRLWAYAAATLFLLLFIGALVLGQEVPLAKPLAEPVWALLVAVVWTVPALVPWLAREVLPRIKSLKVGEFELAFEQARTPVEPVSLLLRGLIDAQGFTMSEFAGALTSQSDAIIRALEEAGRAGHVVMPVDLSSPWVPQNLYFLALLAFHKSSIRQIAFIDSTVEADRFVCTSSPLEVTRALQARHPELLAAARATLIDMDPANLDRMSGGGFFGHLQQAYLNAPQDRPRVLTFSSLLAELGSAAHQDSVQWAGEPTEADYKEIVGRATPFVAALQGTTLLFLIDRDRLALEIARSLSRR